MDNMSESIENKIFENYLSNHYGQVEKTDFSSNADVLTLLKKILQY